MIKNVKNGIALALGLAAGCHGASSDPSTITSASSPAEVSASVAANLDRLRALDVFDVGTLVLELPAEARACYGVPCPGSGLQPVVDAERARQAGRLDKLTTLAVEAARNQYLMPSDKSQAEAAVAALNALQVVQVEALVVAQPKNNPECYNLPCASDIAAADAATGLNVTRVQTTVDAAKASGL